MTIDFFIFLILPLLIVIIPIIIMKGLFSQSHVILESCVKGYEGKCKPTWVNTNQVYNRFDRGVTGFFKLIKPNGRKYGEEFHGIILSDGKVYTTEGR